MDEACACDAEAIGKEAFIFFYPLVENYKTLWYQAVNTDTARYRGPFNKFSHARCLIGPSFDTVVTPNNDTLYSLAWLDLRREPIVLSLPPIPRDRYYSLHAQLRHLEPPHCGTPWRVLCNRWSQLEWTN